MKSICLSLLVVASAMFLSGCRSSYDITLNNGTKITGVTRPRLDNETGHYVFKDAKGQASSIPAMRVRLIEPQGTSQNFSAEKPGSRKTRQ